MSLYENSNKSFLTESLYNLNALNGYPHVKAGGGAAITNWFRGRTGGTTGASDAARNAPVPQPTTPARQSEPYPFAYTAPASVSPRGITAQVFHQPIRGGRLGA